MTTPNRQAIYEKACEQYHEDNPHIMTNPEYEELLESGYISSAISELMTSEARRHAEYFELEKTKDKQPLEVINGLLLDTTEAMRTGLYLTGGRQCGKTNLGKQITVKLISEGINCFVIDPTCAWFDLGLPTVSLEPIGKQTINWNDRSTIFDTSRLHVDLQQKFIELFNKAILDVAISRGKNLQPKTMIVYEEAHTPMPNYILNSKRFRETKRLITQGANFNISFMAITQFSSMIDKLPIKSAQQRYFGRTSEPNDLRYLHAYLGDRTDQLKDLKTGEFIYTFGSERKRIHVPLFQRNLNSSETLRVTYNYLSGGY